MSVIRLKMPLTINSFPFLKELLLVKKEEAVVNTLAVIAYCLNHERKENYIVYMSVLEGLLRSSLFVQNTFWSDCCDDPR